MARKRVKPMKLPSDVDMMQEWKRSREVGQQAHEMIFNQQPDGHVPIEEFLPSPLSIPVGKSGPSSITHRIVAEQTPVIGMRQALMRGCRPVMLALEPGLPLIIHELRERGGIWMTDLPEELHQIAVMLRQVRPYGRVLVGGLGLGLVAHYLARLLEVREITIVERSAHVIKLIKPHLPPRYRGAVVQSDIAKFLRTSGRRFDYYLLDTWQGTSESTWWDEVIPLKRIIRRRWASAPTVHCWAEDIMAGQVLEKLASTRRNWYYEKLPPDMSAEEAAHFFRDVGLPAWEKQYGNAVGQRGVGKPQ